MRETDWVEKIHIALLCALVAILLPIVLLGIKIYEKKL